ncbi:hypothetical protein ALT761_01973 [Alteromonas sp. 76-1]|jgi:hypothetical protein|uniref:hypothetical protein n=1 Tax=Alteromonas sp. 76-1 TaxID=2358187 RepID=UPI000FD1860E|nr:hypothetical protein [Alteromonas sp. 76-1]VEL96974.1 hypothetical protein ALT761_01973 [Alteromonas sp. 76-1]
MSLISTAFEWAIDQWAVTLTALVFIYNWVFKPENKQLLACSLTVTLMYALGHFLLAWINEIPLPEQVTFRYSSRLLLYALAVGFLAACVYKIGPNTTTNITFASFIVAMVLQLLLHIDRNVLALNAISEYIATGVVTTNLEVETGYWALWDWYTGILNASAAVLIIYLTIGEELKEYLCSRFS